MSNVDPGHVESHRELRRQALERLKGRHGPLSDMSTQSVEQLVHELEVYQVELEVYQVELEVQNEELRRVQIERESVLERYQDLYDRAPVAYLTLDASGVIVKANQTAAQLCMRDRDDLEGLRLERLLTTEDRDKQWLLLRRVAATGLPQMTSYRLLRPAGDFRWAHAEVTLEDRAAGASAGFRLALIDITERVTAEQSLQESETFSRQVLEHSPDCVALLDEQGRLQYMNAQGRALLEIDDFAMYARRPWRDLWPEEARAAVEAAVAQALQGQAARFQAYGPTLRGRAKWWDVIVSPIGPTSGQNRQLICVSRDVTERRDMLETLSASEERFRTMAETAAEGIWLLDDAGRTQYANSHMAGLLGCSREELSGRRLLDFCLRQDRPAAQAWIDATLDGRSQTFDFTLRRLDGELVHVLTGTSPLADDAGHIRVLGMFTDVTARQRALNYARLLAEATRAMHESLDRTRIAETLAHLAVPELADWSALHLFEEDGAVRVAAATHRTPERTGAVMAAAARQADDKWSAIVRSAYDRLVRLDSTDERLRAWPPEASDIRPEAIVMAPLLTPHRLLGWLTLARQSTSHAYSDEEVLLIEELARRAALAMEYAVLFQEAQAWTATLEVRVDERTRALQASQRQLRELSSYQQRLLEMERRRIAQEIHDELGGTLTGLKMMVKRIEQHPEGEAGRPSLDEMSQLIDTAVQTVRRIASDLRPAVLDSLGLVPALEWLTEELEKRSGITCVLKAQVANQDCADDLRTTLFRIVQESLTNVARHAQATLVVVSLKQHEEELELQIQDNGTGVREEDLLPGQSFGVIGMRERIAQVNGTFSLARREHGGTVVRVTVPWRPQPA